MSRDLLLFSICLFVSNAFAQTSYVRTHSGSYLIEKAAGSGFYLNSGNEITRCNAEGNVVWTKKYSLTPVPIFQEFTVTPQGNLVLYGKVVSSGWEKEVVLCCDSAGVVLWCWGDSLGFSTLNVFTNAWIYSDSTHIISMQSQEVTARVLLLDHSGTLIRAVNFSTDSLHIWTNFAQPYQTNLDDMVFTGCRSDKLGNYYFSYWVEHPMTPLPYFTSGLIKTDSLLNIVWIRPLHMSTNDRVNLAISDYDGNGNLLFFGQTLDITSNRQGGLVALVDTSGVFVSGLGLEIMQCAMSTTKALFVGMGDIQLVGWMDGVPNVDCMRSKTFVMNTDLNFSFDSTRFNNISAFTQSNLIHPVDAIDYSGQLVFTEDYGTLNRLGLGANASCMDSLSLLNWNALSFSTGGDYYPMTEVLNRILSPVSCSVTVSPGTYSSQLLCLTDIEEQPIQKSDIIPYFNSDGETEIHIPTELIGSSFRILDVMGRSLKSGILLDEILQLSNWNSCPGIYFFQIQKSHNYQTISYIVK